MDERQQLLACANNCASLLNDMARCENEIDYLTEKESKFKKRVGWIGLGLVLCPLLALGGITDLISNTALLPAGRTTDIVGAVIMLALTAVCVLAIKNHIKRKARIPQATSEYASLCADPAISWLPPNYRNSVYARKIIEYLTNMRAKTLQEALNLLETEKHQATMEAIAAVGAINGTRY